MADLYSIDELITAHHQALNFSWLTPSRPGRLPSIATMTYWVGKYTPEHHHAIEIIHRHNLPLFEQSLQQNALYLTTGNTSTQPSLIIFADEVSCASNTLAAVQQLGIAALHSPMPARQILRELAYTLAERGAHQTRHGVMLSICGQGIFLAGNSGIGKSAIALELLARGHRLVADDAPLLHHIPDSRQVYALCPPMLADMLEVRALGILNVCKLFGPKASVALMPVDLVIELVEASNSDAYQRLQPYSKPTNILGVDIPSRQIPIRHTANLALIVETLTKNHVLYNEGYDASVILTQRQQQLLDKQTI